MSKATLEDDILKVFPKFFGDFKNWEYGNGTDAGKDFKRIYNKAKKQKINIDKVIDMLSDHADLEADFEDTSPDDSFAHIHGLCIKLITE